MMGDIHYGKKEGSDMNEWQLKIDLDNQSIEKIGSYIDKKLPKYFIDFLKNTNASSPVKDKFKIEEEVYVLNSILNFNENSKDSFYDIYENLKDILEKCIPFGRDGLGNYICINLDEFKVYFYNHEDEKKSFLSTFDNYINNLY